MMMNVKENTADINCYCVDENYPSTSDYCRICQRRRSPPYVQQKTSSFYQQANKQSAPNEENEEEEKIVFIPAILSSRGRPKSRLEEPILNSKFERPNDSLYSPLLSYEANQQTNFNQSLYQSTKQKSEKSLYMYMGKPDGTVDISRPVPLEKFNHMIQPIGFDNFELPKPENSKRSHSPFNLNQNLRNTQYNLPSPNQKNYIKEKTITTQTELNFSDDSDNYI